jgi:hypothetical protein
MSGKYQRVVRIGEIDTATGVFPATLATEGEASDGHILAIKGGRIPARMPLLPSHWNDPQAVLGSLTNPTKALGEKPPVLRMDGQIETDGKGVPLELRQDLLHMIAKGHVTGMSIRWDEVPGKPPVRRVNLPSDHPHFVDAETEKDMAKRYGYYFEHWQALEGSIVALGADKQALIGRADETSGPVSTFWRSMAEDTEEPAHSVIDAIECTEEDVEPDESAQIAAALAALRIHLADCREAGCDISEIYSGFWEAFDADEHAEIRKCDVDFRSQRDEIRELSERLEAAEARADAAEAALEEAQEEPDPDQDQDTAPAERTDQPSPLALDADELRKPIDVQALGRLMSRMIDESEERISREVGGLIAAAQGKVD